ncbi:hypothetical protein BGZ91_006465 [Linnemannia elongata]|nr:hypothetical protein BGZ91_006465 [Linnemannia elongata]KAG0075187.1 hypothetical protein BGZ90_010130 [Linnemannia elongata]
MISTRAFTAFLFVVVLALTVQAVPVKRGDYTFEECMSVCEAQNKWCSSAKKRDGSPMFTNCAEISGQCRTSCNFQFGKI